MLSEPRPSRAVAAFKTSFRWTTALDRRQAFRATVSFFVAAMFLDWVTGQTVSAVAAYLFVIALSAWTMREKAGFVAICLSVAATQLLNGFGSTHPIEGLGLSAGAAVWNTLSRALIAVLIVLLVSTLRHSLDVERWRAATDRLTGVLNKSGFEKELKASVALAQARKSKLLLTFMDLDGFKGVNDKYGHAAGDQVLSAFAAEALSRIRSDDVFARIGGDEFAALLLLDERADGAELAEALHARLTIALSATGHPVTCSMGAVVLDQAPDDIETVVELADTLMYEVKRSGKNGLRLAFAGAADVSSCQRTVMPLRAVA